MSFENPINTETKLGNIPLECEDGTIFIHGSCNGLFLLSALDRHEKEFLCIWNPFTKKCINLPEFPGICLSNCSKLGFGYDALSKDYKVAHIQGFCVCDPDYYYEEEAYVFSLASNTWREIPLPLPTQTIDGILWTSAVFGDGALHWLSHSNNSIEIISFDISREEFLDLIPGIQFPANTPHVEADDMSLEVLEGGLVFCKRISPHHIELSYAVKHGQRIAWTKFDTLDLTRPIKGLHHARFVGWNPPSPGVIKLNTDGAARGNPGMAGAGGLLRNSNGRWLIGFAAQIGVCSSVVAELQALRLGLLLAWGQGYRNIICEVDSSAILELIATVDVDDHDPSMAIILNVREILKREWQCSIRHTLREGNFCADKLSKLGNELGVKYKLYRDPPYQVYEVLKADEMGVVYPRGYRI